MRLYFVRHGQTANNRAKRLQGRSDSPLNEEGVRQAELVREFFAAHGIKVTKVYSSPLQRAVQTAEIISSGQAGIVCENRLLEMDYGPYEGCSLDSPPVEIIRFFQDFVHNPAPEGMESLSGVKQRLGSFLQDIRTESDETILVSTHAIAMKGALEYLDPGSNGSYWSKYISNCAVYRSGYSAGSFLVPEEIFSIGYEPGV